MTPARVPANQGDPSPHDRGEPKAVLGAMDAAGGRAWLSAFTYTLAQLALIAGLLGVAHLLRERTPLLSSLGGTLPC